MLYQVKEEQLKLKDKTIDYISFGRGAKTLVMIQGLNTRGIRGAAIPLAWMYRIFSKDYRVYIFDRKMEITKGVTIKELTEDLSEAMDALHISYADILGVSQGGVIAQSLAIHRPDLVRKMVLAVTYARDNEILRNTVEHWIELTKQDLMKELISDMAAKMYSESYVRRYQPILPILTFVQKPKDRNRFLYLAQSCLDCNVYEDLNKISCPVFVIGGQGDLVVGAEASLEIAEKLRCECYMYENLGHALYEEAKDFNQRVYDFLSDS